MNCPKCNTEIQLKDFGICPNCKTECVIECPLCAKVGKTGYLVEYIETEKGEISVKDEERKKDTETSIWKVMYQKFLHKKGLKCNYCGYTQIVSNWDSERKIKEWKESTKKN
jgi:hypothetical protein